MGGDDLSTALTELVGGQEVPPATGLAAEPWGSLLLTLGAAFHTAVVAWLALFVVVPTVAAGMSPVVVTSGSMQPGIRPGDMVLLTDPPTDLGPGTVITFADAARGGELVTHRVVAVTPDGRYRTRGDANPTADSTPVAPDQVVGVGRLLVPLAGLPVLWWGSQPLLVLGWALVAAVLAWLAVLPPAGRRRGR